MKTRLRIPHSKEDDPQRADRPSHETTVPDRFGDIFAMQRTHGNAYMQRYLGALAAGKPAPNFISRDTPRTTGNAPVSPQPACYITITDSEGKPFKGGSKRKGREGQIECFSVTRQNTGHGNLSRGRDGEEKNRIKKERIAGANVTTTKEQTEFAFMKLVDEASPELMSAVNSGTPVKVHIEFVKVDKDGVETTYMMLDLNDALLSGVQSSSGGHQPMESVSVSSMENSVTIPDSPQPETTKWE